MDLTVEPPRATIAADVSGTTAAVLALVDRPPLQLATPLGIVPVDVGGECRVHTELRLPIKAGLAAAAIGVRATANLRAASMPNVAGGIGIADAELALTVDGARVTVKGTTALTGVADVTKPVTVALDVTPGAARSERRATLTLDGDGVTARATGTFAGGELTALAVERLRFGGSDVGGTLRRRGADHFEATLGGAMLDLGALLADPRPIRAGTSGPGGSYDVTVDLARVLGTGGVDVRALRGTLRMSTAGGGDDAAARVDALMLTGTLAGRGDVRATIEAGTGSRRVSVTSDDAGRFLSAFGGLEQMVGGSLVLDAHTDARGPAAWLEGTLVVRDFRLVRAPVLAKVLGIGSLGGVAALLNGDGMPFVEARVPFRWDGARLALHDVRAIGAVGLTADGVLERDAATCDVRGNIIPAYSLNSALGKVPLIGRFLVGRKGEGVFGIDYRVSGKTADPTVRVNPLTSVAPTVLRAWFIEPFRRAPP